MKLLVIEDSSTLRANLETGFRRAGFAVDVATDGGEVLRMALATHYDVVLLDLGLPVLDGMDVLRRLREEGNPTHVLALTARDALEDRVRGLDGGADDYVVKPFSFDELLARVRTLCRRAYGSGASTIEVGNLLLDLGMREVRIGEKGLELTRREFALLEYLVLRRGQVVRREEIEQSLYETCVGPTSNVVDACVLRLRRKLDAAQSTAQVQTLRGVGYRFDAAAR